MQEEVLGQLRVEIVGDEGHRVGYPLRSKIRFASSEIQSAALAMRHDVEDRVTVAGDDDRLTALNLAGEFVYSTYLAPVSAATALAAIGRVRELAEERPGLQAISVEWRDALCAAGFAVPTGDSPIIPLILGDSDVTLRYATALRSSGFMVSAIRPPTVPVRTGRIRISLRRGLTATSLEAFLSVLKGVSR